MAEAKFSKSNYWKTAVINLLRGTNATPPAKLYVALYTSNPTGADTGTEVSGGAYARQEIAFGASAITGQVARVTNTADIVFPIATADWGSITHVGVRDAATGGNLIYHGELTTPRSVVTNDRIRFLVGKFMIDEG